MQLDNWKRRGLNNAPPPLPQPSIWELLSRRIKRFLDRDSASAYSFFFFSCPPGVKYNLNAERSTHIMVKGSSLCCTCLLNCHFKLQVFLEYLLLLWAKGNLAQGHGYAMCSATYTVYAKE